MRKVIAAVAMAALTLSACGTLADTAPDQMALVYAGGTFDAQAFKKCVDPSVKKYEGFGDKIYSYPVGQRTFTFTDDMNNKDRDASAISITTKDPLDMKVTGTATFTFVNTCEKLREFHEKVGFKYLREAEEKGGGFNEAWAAFLETYFRQDLEKAMDATAKALEWRTLYGAPDVKETWEDSVAELSPKIMEEHAKATYFTDIRLSLDTPQPPQSVIDSLRGRQVAIEDNNAQKERNAKALTELEGFKACKDMIGTEACMTKYSIDSGKVQQVIVAPKDGAVNVGGKN